MIMDGRPNNEPAVHEELVRRLLPVKRVSWNAIAIFRFEQQKIIEEWVTRDELAMILQFGLLEPARDMR